MPLTLSEPTSARLTAVAAQYGMDAEELLIALLDQQDSPPAEDEDDSLVAIAEGLAELRAGKGRPFDEYVAEQRARWSAQGS